MEPNFAVMALVAELRDSAGLPRVWDLNFSARLEATNGGPIRTGRGITIPSHGGRDIGPPLFYRLLGQLEISVDDFRKLK